MIPRALAFTLLISLSTSLTFAQTGSVSGTVTLPEKDPIKRMASRYRETDARSLGDPAPLIAVVYLSNSKTASLTKPATEISSIAQRGLHFYPRTLPITLGSRVSFPNEDDTFHNVFSYSPAKEFDLGRYRKDETPPTRQFETAGVVSVFCEVHRHMQANILVLETPYFASTDAHGNFMIEGIEPGEYEVTVWITPRNNKTHRVTILPGQKTELDFE